MALFKSTWFFELGCMGWSESLYVDATTHNDALFVAQLYRADRVNMLSKPGRMTFIRISDNAIQGDAQLTAIPKKDGQAFALPFPSAAAWQTALVRMNTNDFLNRRNMFLRGIPDSDEGNRVDFPPGGLKLGAAFQKAFNIWKLGLKTTGWKFLGIDATVPFQQITNITAVLPGVPIILTVDAHGIPDGSKVLVRGVQGMKGINTQWFVTVPSANLLSLVNSENEVTGVHKFGGEVRLTTIIPHLIDVANVIKLTHRQTGRPFGLAVGRRKRQRIIDP